MERPRPIWLELMPTVLALVGVVIGALATGWVTYALDARRDDARVRQAKRLVAAEATEVELRLRGLQAGGWRRFKENGPVDLPTHEWHANEATLARGLSRDDWLSVEAFYSDVGRTRVLVRRWKVVPRGARRPLILLADYARDVQGALGGEPSGPVRIIKNS
jgi:hypothetical protein